MLLAIVTVTPPVGARWSSVIVPVAVLRFMTLAGSRVNPLRAGGLTVRVAEAELFGLTGLAVI